MANSRSDNTPEIAIIGMSGRFPGARNVEEFWQNLRSGIEGIRRYTDEELRAAHVAESVLRDPRYVKAGALLEEADEFDAEFFGFTPREAEVLDPQQRVLLECACEALERAGYDPWQAGGAAGVYVGGSLSTYLLKYLSSNQEILDSVGGLQVVLSNDKDFLATRVSYKLNLQGPSLTVQTACSTSLVAVHLACQALLCGECDLALAGGVSITEYEKRGYYYQPGGLLSADGKCRAFDAGATGTVAGNGVGIVVLKRLSDALAENDQIHAVIKGSAIINDGALKIGYTAPRIEGEAKAIKIAQIVARVTPKTIGYVEAHGSGTELGDPIEVAALREAFGDCGGRRQFCAIGSVKTNVGHLDAAAGVAGLIKAVLALRHQELPPSLHYEKANPKIPFEESPFYVNTQLRQWSVENGQKRRAGVSSFGIGGTNAHIVLEEPPTRLALPIPHSQSVELAVLTARTPGALARARQRLAGHIRQHPTRLADIAWTLQVGRREYQHREAVVCRNIAEAAEALEGKRPSAVIKGQAPESPRGVSYLIPGVGDHYMGMAKGLFEMGGRFREELEHCSQLFEAETGERILAELYRDVKPDEKAASQLRRWVKGDKPEGGSLLGIVGQAAVFTVGYALTAMWKEWGVKPKRVIGYSLGEYVAACVAGVMNLGDAVRMIAIRERLIETGTAGAMVTAGVGAQEIERQLTGRLEVAIDCSPGVCVVGGPKEEIEDFEHRLNEQGVIWRRLDIGFAIHTAMMQHAAGKLEQEVRSIKLREPEIEYVSNVFGRRVLAGEVTEAKYWARHLCERVRFREGVSALIEDCGGDVLLETGPGQTLGSFAQQTAVMKGKEALVVGSLRNQHEEIDDREYTARSIGKLWASGVRFDWKAMHKGQSVSRVELPTYPFERTRYWVGGGERQKQKEPALGKEGNIEEWLYMPSWKRLAQAAREHEPAQKTRWLMFGDGSHLSRSIGEQINQVGERLTLVYRGTEFEQSEPGIYRIDSSSRQHYSQLLRALRERELLPDKIIYLWNVGDAEGDDDPEEESVKKNFAAFFSLFFLAQAIGEINVSQKLTLFVISNHAELIEKADVVEPRKSLVKGLCRVLPQEYVNVMCRHIDIDIDCSAHHEQSAASLAPRLLREIRSDDCEAFIALRGRHRWVPHLARIKPERDRSAKALRSEGVYLITGGLGGIGLTIAGYLAGAVKAKLILTGWRALPPRTEWQQWISEHGEEDEISQRISKIRDLESAGAEVAVLEADVADHRRMKEVVSIAHSRFGRINGVIHTAGLAGGGLLQVREVEAVERVLRAKVEGTQVVASVVEKDQPDFIVLCSSLGSLLGGVGQADYCAANAFQDAFAQMGWAEGKKIVSINWDTWQEVGMAMRTAVSGVFSRLRDEGIQQGITPIEGAEIFARVLGCDEAQVAVSTHDLEERMERQIRMNAGGLREQLDKIEFELERKGREGLSSEWVGARNALESRVIEVWERVLGIGGIGIHDNFFELGGNSLMGIQLLSRLREAVGTELPLSVLFSSPTAAELSIVLRQPGSEKQVASLLEFIVPMSPYANGDPWFFVHPVGGGASCYFELARLLRGNQRVYGIKSFELVTLWGPDGKLLAPVDLKQSIEEIAGQYAEAIRMIQPEGPYTIGGWSFGGLVAFEMARQLMASGHRVAKVLILDSSIVKPVSEREKIDSLDYETALEIATASGRRLEIACEDFESLAFEQQIECLFEHLKTVYGLTDAAGVELISRLVHCVRARYESSLSYEPAAYNGNVVLIRAGKVDKPEYCLSQDPEQTNGWAAVVANPIPVFTIPGDHLNIVYTPYVEALAKVLDGLSEETNQSAQVA